MAVRFSPFTKLKIFSLASYISENLNYSIANRDKEIAKNQDGLVKDFIELLVSDKGIEANTKIYNKGRLNQLFHDVGLATSVQVIENYNTKPSYNLGEPYNPMIMPGNLSMKVTIGRLTTDSRQIADYVTRPNFYYSKGLQTASFKNLSNPGEFGVGHDYSLLFYTYFFMDSLEEEIYTSELGKIQNAEIIAFIPNSYTKRIESGDAAIVTEVEGEGKLFRLDALLAQLFTALTSFSPIQQERLESLRFV